MYLVMSEASAMKLALIEDNHSIQITIQKQLANHSNAMLIGIADSVDTGLKLINDSKPDLVLLDVEIIGGSGFDILKKVEWVDFQVIFITAHEKYALRAIKFSALDYLLKPIDEDELMTAIEKAKSNLNLENFRKKRDILLENISQSNGADKLVLQDQYNIQIVKISDIIRLESGGSYTIFIIKEMENVIASKGLKHFENVLPSKHFFRSHQSHMINLNWLMRYEKKDGDFLLLQNNDRVPLATRKREKLMEFIKNL